MFVFWQWMLFDKQEVWNQCLCFGPFGNTLPYHLGYTFGNYLRKPMPSSAKMRRVFWFGIFWFRTGLLSWLFDCLKYLGGLAMRGLNFLSIWLRTRICWQFVSRSSPLYTWPYLAPALPKFFNKTFLIFGGVLNPLALKNCGSLPTAPFSARGPWGKYFGHSPSPLTIVLWADEGLWWGPPGTLFQRRPRDFLREPSVLT